MTVTGGAGFIGSHLVEALAEQDHEVHVLDLSVSGADESKVEGFDWIKHQNVTFHRGSVADYNFLYKIMQRTDVTFHLSTLCLVKGLEEPHPIHEVNDLGTYNVCVAANLTGNKIVFIGTSEEYGPQQSNAYPIKESNPLNPVSLYGLTKAVGERYVRFFHEMYGVPAVIIRPFNTFGPRQREDGYAGVITSFIKRVRSGYQPIIYGSGGQTRDFTYVSDIVDGILKLSELEDCEIVNLGSGIEHTILDIAHLIWEVWGCRGVCRPLYGGGRVNDVPRLLADVSRAKEFGWIPRTSFREGVGRYIQWIKEGKK